MNNKSRVQPRFDMPRYFPQLDIIKFLAITSVIILHSVSIQTLRETYSDFHILQAVPVFFIVSGITLAISHKQRGCLKLNEFYAKEYMLLRCRRLLLPFAIIFVLSLAAGL